MVVLLSAEPQAEEVVSWESYAVQRKMKPPSWTWEEQPHAPVRFGVNQTESSFTEKIMFVLPD